MPSTLFGVPAHPLVVHGVVVLVPLVAVLAVAVALSSRVRAWGGWLVAAGAVLDVALVPMATASGENLERQVPGSALVDRHTHMAEQLLPWVIALAVGVLAVMLLTRRRTRTWLVSAAVALTVVGAAGAVVEVVRIGHSGAKAVWSDTAG